MRTLTEIVKCQQGLHVSVMETLALLFEIGEIECGAGFDVVDMPYGSVINPRHSRQELGLKIRFELWDSAAQ